MKSGIPGLAQATHTRGHKDAIGEELGPFGGIELEPVHLALTAAPSRVFSDCSPGSTCVLIYLGELVFRDFQLGTSGFESVFMADSVAGATNISHEGQ